jgi:hypothetical protein
MENAPAARFMRFLPFNTSARRVGSCGFLRSADRRRRLDAPAGAGFDGDETVRK